MLIPESADEKERAHLKRMSGWLNRMSEEERKKYCDHGNSFVIRMFTCKYCKREEGES